MRMKRDVRGGRTGAEPVGGGKAERNRALAALPLPSHASEATVGCVIESPGPTQYKGPGIACRSPSAELS
jgi:hypothetical protein